MRYVHPQEQAVQKLFVRLGGLERPERLVRSVQHPVQCVESKRSVQNPVQWLAPSEAIDPKVLINSGLQRAEVVELADTPS